MKQTEASLGAWKRLRSEKREPQRYQKLRQRTEVGRPPPYFSWGCLHPELLIQPERNGSRRSRYVHFISAELVRQMEARRTEFKTSSLCPRQVSTPNADVHARESLLEFSPPTFLTEHLLCAEHCPRTGVVAKER